MKKGTKVKFSGSMDNLVLDFNMPEWLAKAVFEKEGYVNELYDDNRENIKSFPLKHSHATVAYEINLGVWIDVLLPVKSFEEVSDVV
jgi:hypothetical protein